MTSVIVGSCKTYEVTHPNVFKKIRKCNEQKGIKNVVHFE